MKNGRYSHCFYLLVLLAGCGFPAVPGDPGIPGNPADAVQEMQLRPEPTFTLERDVPSEAIERSGRDTKINGGQTFVSSLPPDLQEKVLWFSDFEEGDFSSWEDEGTGDYYAGGGIFLTGGENAAYGITGDVVHSGRFASFTRIDNAYMAQGPRAVRLMRWCDRAWNEGGDYFPDEAYYSVWMFFPYVYDPGKEEPWDPGDGGWWNVFQFKSENEAGSQPLVELDVYNENSSMFFGLSIKEYPDPESDMHQQAYHVQLEPEPIPISSWVHVEVFYRKAQDSSGEVVVWQDGREIFRVERIQTMLTETAAWGIGNYTDHITGGAVPGQAVVFFDDAVISGERVGQIIASP